MAGYRRFLILSTARTGSTLLVQALNSHPAVRCFREVYNGRMDYVDFSLDGYDNFDARDLALRKEDPVRFLHERIFCAWPPEVRAVGFKYLYEQHDDFPTLIHELTADTELHVIHLQRRNDLRMLVSSKIARRTGVWVEDAAKLTRWRVMMAVRHPLRAAGRLQRLVSQLRPLQGPSRRVAVSQQEYFEFMLQHRMRMSHYDAIFKDHPQLSVFYEDLVQDRDAVFADVQRLLGLEPRPLTVSVRQQNPEPLRDLIENYDELRAAFAGLPEAAFFDD